VLERVRVKCVCVLMRKKEKDR